MPATAKPTATNAANVMCRHCVNAAGFNIAASGSTSITLPAASIVKPVGVFIQAFAVTTKRPDRMPITNTRMPDARCTRGDSRFQPYR